MKSISFLELGPIDHDRILFRRSLMANFGGVVLLVFLLAGALYCLTEGLNLWAAALGLAAVAYSFVLFSTESLCLDRATSVITYNKRTVIASRRKSVPIHNIAHIQLKRWSGRQANYYLELEIGSDDIPLIHINPPFRLLLNRAKQRQFLEDARQRISRFLKPDGVGHEY